MPSLFTSPSIRALGRRRRRAAVGGHVVRVPSRALHRRAVSPSCAGPVAQAQPARGRGRADAPSPWRAACLPAARAGLRFHQHPRL